MTVILLTGLPLASQVNSKAAPSEKDIEYLESLLNMVVSSGSFLDLNADKFPASVSVITSEMIRVSGARHMSELLEIYVPGFQYMFNKWNGTLWGMRGVANDRNSKIIFLVNGHKLNTQARDGFQSETVLGFLGDIERVEVLRGPAGLVYGSGAISGIINVVTRKSDENSTEIRTFFGSNSSRSVELNLFSTPSDNQKFSFSTGFRRSDGLPAHESRVYGLGSWPYPNALDTEYLVKNGVPSDGNYGSTDGNWKVAAGLDVGQLSLYFRATRQKENAGGLFIIDPWPHLKGNYPTDSMSGIGYVDGKPVKYNDPFWSQAGESEGTTLRQYLADNIMLEGSYRYQLGADELEIRAGLDANTTRIASERRDRYLIESEHYEYPDEEGETARYWDLPHASANPDYVDETFGETRLTLNSMYLSKSIPDIQIAAGVEYRLDMIGSDLEGRNEKEENSKHPVVSEINYQTFSLFSEGFYDVTGRIGLLLGGRLDFHTRAVMANPKIALVFRPSESHSLKLIYQTSSNNGSADNYEYNRHHFQNDGTLKEEISFERPYDKPHSSSDVLPQISPLHVLHELEPEKVRSAEITSTHFLGDNFTVMPSFAFGKVSDLFGWSQTLFRVVNVGRYSYMNLDLDTKYESGQVKVGLNHTYQRPVNVDISEQKEIFIQPKVDKESQGWYDSIFDEERNQWKYFPVASDSLIDTVEINIVKDAITADGRNFLNLSTNVSKFYLTYMPFEWMALHTNLRLFWGLQGRDILYRKDKGFNYLDISENRRELGWREFFSKSVSKKLNASILFYLPQDIEISLLAYDILGVEQSPHTEDNGKTINTVRWQHMAQPEQKELYSTDQRTFSLSITKSF
ncbi:MAG: TonB-dependent receptor plug domain-containing protein [Chitinispirillaceae bacterium]